MLERMIVTRNYACIPIESVVKPIFIGKVSTLVHYSDKFCWVDNDDLDQYYQFEQIVLVKTTEGFRHGKFFRHCGQKEVLVEIDGVITRYNISNISEVKNAEV